MAVREEILRLVCEIAGVDPASAEFKSLRTEVERLIPAGEGAATALKTTAGALNQVEAAEQDTKAATVQTTEALSVQGAVAVETAQATASAAAQEANALEEVSAAALDEAEALRAAAAAENEAAESAAKLRAQLASATETAMLFTNAAEATRSSDLGLEVQRAGLQAMATELQKLTEGYVKQGAAGKDAANVTGTALTTVKAKLADVNDEIREEIASMRRMGDAGKAGFDEIRGATLTFETAAAGAIKQVNATWEQFNETQRITPRQLGFTVQAVESMKIAMLEAAQRGTVATKEQIELYERMEKELTTLTAQANRLTNASRDNAFRLKESGNQLQGLTAGVQQLTAALGPNAAKIGFLVGNVGQLGGAYESLKDSIAGLNLNSLTAARSATTLGIQLTAVLATLAAAIAAGLKLADTNKENADTMHKVTEAVKDQLPTLSGLRDGLDGVQLSIQNVISDLDRFVVYSDGAFGQGEFHKNVSDLAVSLGQLIISFKSGRTGADLFALGLREGLPEVEASKLAVGDYTEVLRFYNDARDTGAKGQALWRKAMEESGNTANGLIEKVRELIPEMDTLRGLHGKLPEALQKEFEARQKLNRELQISRGLYEAERERIRAASSETQNYVQRTLEQNEVLNGSTRAINERLLAIARDIGKSSEHAAALADQAAKLKILADGTAGLSREERARLDLVIELASRGAELTDQERVYAEALAEGIAVERQAAVAAIARRAATVSVKDALDDLVVAEKGRALALTESETAVGKYLTTQLQLDSALVAALKKTLAAQTDLSAAERTRYKTILELSQQIDELVRAQERANQSTKSAAEAADIANEPIRERLRLIEAEIEKRLEEQGVQEDANKINLDAGGSLEYLRQKQRALNEELSAGSGVVKSGIDLTQQEIDTRAQQIVSTLSQIQATEKLATSNAQLVGTIKDGQVVITNVGTSLDEAGQATTRAGEATKSALPHVEHLTEKYTDLKTVIEGVNEKMRIAKERADDLAESTDKAADAVGRLETATAKASGYGTAVQPQ